MTGVSRRSLAITATVATIIASPLTGVAAAAPAALGGPIDGGSVADLFESLHPAFAGDLQIDHLDTVIVTDAPEFDGAPVGGLSGLDYSPAQGYIAISDDRAEHGPVRMYTLSLPLIGDRLGEPEFIDQIELRDLDGSAYAPGRTDTESIRWTPDGTGVIYTSEGDADAEIPGFIRRADLDGAAVEEYPLPDYYAPRADADGRPEWGVRDNLGFESTTLSTDRRSLIAVTEDALAQDGPITDHATTSTPRLIELDIETGATLRELVYPLGPVPQDEFPQARGVAEILAVDDESFLALERSVAETDDGYRPVAQIFEVSTVGAQNIADQPVVQDGAVPVHKTLLFDFADVGIDPQIAEALTWGPELDDGRRSLVLTTDDNFGEIGETAFHLLAVRRVDAAHPGSAFFR